MEFTEIKQILSDAAALAGIQEYDAYYSVSSDISAEALKDEISGFSSSDSIGLGFRCIVDGKFGQASCERITESELKELVFKATENAKYIESDDEAIIHKGSVHYEAIESKEIEFPSSGDLKDITLEIQKKTYAQSEKVIDGTQSGCGAGRTEVHFFNSYGLDLYKSASFVSYCSYPVVSDGEETEDSGESKMAKDFGDIDAVVKKAVNKAEAKLGADSVPSGKYNIVLSGKRFASFLSEFVGCFSAKSVKLGLSKLSGKIGDRVAADIITITDDPFSDELCGKNHFDGEGVATYTKNVIENGVLKTYLYDLAMAKHFGVQPTGNATRSYSTPVAISPYFLYVNKGDKKLEELFEMAGNGIYITELTSFSASNGVTGDFSIESAGYLIENGRLGKFVKSFTIAGNFFDFLKNIEAISDEIEVKHSGIFRGYAAPAAFVKNISVAGK